MSYFQIIRTRGKSRLSVHNIENGFPAIFVLELILVAA